MFAKLADLRAAARNQYKELEQRLTEGEQTLTDGEPGAATSIAEEVLGAVETRVAGVQAATRKYRC